MIFQTFPLLFIEFLSLVLAQQIPPI